MPNIIFKLAVGNTRNTINMKKNFVVWKNKFEQTKNCVIEVMPMFSLAND